MNSINNITDKIILMAKKYEEELNIETDRQIGDIRDEYQSKAEYIKRKIMSDTKKECDEILARARSEAEFKKRNIILSTKVGIIENALEGARQKIINMSDETYLAFCVKLLSKTISDYENWVKESETVYDENIGESKYVLKLNARDKSRIGTSLCDEAKRLTNKEVSLCERDCDIDGGFIFAAGNIEINCTVKSLIDNKRDELFSRLNKLLFG